MTRPRHNTTQKAATTASGPRAQLFADHGKNEIGVRLGQIEELLLASHEAVSENAPEPKAMND